jgi:hypothetical protein
MFLYFCGDMCCEWAKWMGPVVVNVKRDLQPGRAQCVVSKVRWSVVR